MGVGVLLRGEFLQHFLQSLFVHLCQVLGHQIFLRGNKFLAFFVRSFDLLFQGLEQRVTYFGDLVLELQGLQTAPAFQHHSRVVFDVFLAAHHAGEGIQRNAGVGAGLLFALAHYR